MSSWMWTRTAGCSRATSSSSIPMTWAWISSCPDIVQRMRFEHPEVKVAVLALGARTTCSAPGRISACWAGAAHSHKVNFCKFTNETRNTFERRAEAVTAGQKWIRRGQGRLRRGGYELALACNYIILTDDSTSSVALLDGASAGGCCPAPAG